LIMFRTLGVFAGASPPAIDVTPPGAVELKGVNTLEVTGRASAGTGVLHLLRKVVYEVSGVKHFQFRPWAEDRGADSADFADGWFSIRLRILADDPTDEFILWNPGGALTIDPAFPLLIREARY
jgi:hypothetical protein